MSTTIYKYPLAAVVKQEINLPKGAQILSVQTQNGDICLWAQVNPGRDETGRRFVEGRIFEIFGTGHPIPEGMGISRKFLGTVQLEGGSLVFHVFERIN